MGEPRDVEALVAELREHAGNWPNRAEYYAARGADLAETAADALASERSRADRLEKALTEVRPCILGYIDRCDYTKGHAALAIVDAALSADGGSRG